MGFNCNGFSIKLVKIAQDSEIRYSRLTHEWTTRERSREKHMFEFEQSFAKLYFASHFTLRQLVSDLQNSLPE